MDIGFTASGSGGGSGSTYTEVANFASLPSASSVSGSTYLVIATTGVIFVNRKLAGLYKSNGTTWNFLGDVTSYVNTVGGTAGQVLAKIDSTDFNTQWVTPTAYEPADATILKDADIGSTVQAYNASTTTAGNTFNGVSQLVQTDGTGKLPAIDGSLLTNLPSGASNLDGLTDVALTTPTTDEVLKYNGTAWVNGTSSGGSSSLLAEYIVSGSAVTSIDFSGLDINTHKSYRVEADIINPIASISTIYCFVNNDTTLTNYVSQYTTSYGSTISAARLNNPRVGAIPASSSQSSILHITLCFGLASFVYSQRYHSGLTTNQLFNGTANKLATVTNITQLTFTASVTSSIGLGSSIRIYRGDV